jgi:hypothetical protein
VSDAVSISSEPDTATDPVAGPLQGPGTEPIAASVRPVAARGPGGPARQLTDRLLVHASADSALSLAGFLPDGGSGLVLCGKKANRAAKQLRTQRFTEPVLIDPCGYTQAAATPEEPFVLANEDTLFPVTLDEALQGQRDCGTTAALTPTGYLHAGDTDSLKAAANAVASLNRDDTILGLPLDAAWFKDDHIDSLVAILSRLEAPKAVMLGAQFDPVERFNPRTTVINLRRLFGEAGDLALLRTDLTGFDALCHGAFAASIGTGGSLRHVIPIGQFARSADTKDQSPSVLYGAVMRFYRGSTIAKRYANDVPPTCADCDGRPLDTFLAKTDTAAAHLHGLHTWSRWAEQMRQHDSLAARTIWWRNLCRLAVTEAAAINAQLEQDDAFVPSDTISIWADLPAPPTTPGQTP